MFWSIQRTNSSFAGIAAKQPNGPTEKGKVLKKIFQFQQYRSTLLEDFLDQILCSVRWQKMKTDDGSKIEDQVTIHDAIAISIQNDISRATFDKFPFQTVRSDDDNQEHEKKVNDSWKLILIHKSTFLVSKSNQCHFRLKRVSSKTMKRWTVNAIWFPKENMNLSVFWTIS